MPKTSRNILIAFILNLGFSIYEFIGGTFTNSTAIMSDAIHDFGDALSIGISFILEKKSTKSPDQKYTYGYRRYSLLGGLITTFILLLGSSFAICNAIIHIIHPESINYDGMIVLAIIGVVVNSVAAYITNHGASLNQKSVNLHMLEDVLGWIVVLVGAIIMKFVNITYIDPVLSILVALYILKEAWGNLHHILEVFLEKAPENMAISQIKNHILQIQGIKSIHHLHIWSLDGIQNCATLHVVTNDTVNRHLKEEIRKQLQEYHISHVTIELETPKDQCMDIDCNTSISTNPQPSHHHAH